MELWKRPGQTEVISNVEYQRRIIRILIRFQGTRRITKENKVINPFENLLSTVIQNDVDKTVRDAAKKTCGTRRTESHAMININLPVPGHAEMTLMFWVDRDVAVCAIDVEDSYLRARGSFSDQEIALRE